MSRYLILVMLIILSACKGYDDKGNEHKENADSSLVLRSTYRNLKINDKLSNILKEFITEANCKECIYEMYIDKVRPEESIVVLKSRVYSTEYMKQINPLFTSKINGVQFDIFSGLEDIFIGDKAELATNPGMDTTQSVYKVWSLFIKADSVKIEKDIGNPFFPAEPPKIEIKK